MMTANRKKDKNRKDRCSKAGILELREKRGVKGMTSSWPFCDMHLTCCTVNTPFLH